MKKSSNTIIDDKKTVKIMVAMYCNTHHHTGKGTICLSCKELMDYALLRIENCTFGTKKPTCDVCTVHCYNKVNREEIRKIMRYSGSRMLFKHPILTIKHLYRSKISKR